ncbi:hypothetical protein [Spongiimicrobium salis]|uniref:hypothetical protein n=1 Tax=Spongiimicrobium salis TaxID=1667022 RepID=UPI00374D9EB5
MRTLKILKYIVLAIVLLPMNSCEIEEFTTLDPIVINAVDDGMDGINGTSGATAVINVLDNDTVDDAPATPNTVVISVLGQPNSNITLNADGTIDIAPGTATGEYRLDYEICDRNNEDNCQSAEVVLFIFADSDMSGINAVNDGMDGINGTTGATAIINVLDNDTIDGLVATPNNVNVSRLGQPNDYITINVDGTVDVAANTPEGEYRLNYEICDSTNEDRCASAEVVLFVYIPDGSGVNAVGEAIAGVNGTTGGTGVINVLDNDTIDGIPATPNNVNLSRLGQPNDYITINADGTVDVAPGTPEGEYRLGYEICDSTNEDRCGNTEVALFVFNSESAVINAVDDGMDGIDGTAGANAVINVLDNDTVDGIPATPNTVNVSRLGQPIDGIVLNADGTVDVLPGTPEGEYRFNYEICDSSNEDNCASAEVVLFVFTSTPAVLNAVNDGMDGINGTSGAIGVVNVLDNDTVDGIPAAPNTVNVSRLGQPIDGIVLNADGTVDVLPGTPEGQYRFNYEICDSNNEDNCASAEVILFVFIPAPAVINAVGEAIAGVNGATGGTAVINVLDNDTIDGAPVSTDTINLSLLGQPDPFVTLNADGTVDVAPGTPEGEYRLRYELCDSNNEDNCATAEVAVFVFNMG